MKSYKKLNKKIISPAKDFWDTLQDHVKIEIENKVKEIIKEAVHTGLDAFALAIRELRTILKKKTNPITDLNELYKIIEESSKLSTSEDEQELNPELFEIDGDYIFEDICNGSDEKKEINIIFVGGSNVLYNKDRENSKLDSYIFIDHSLDNLKVISEETDSYIVITAGMRKTPEGKQFLKDKLATVGLKNRIIGYTMKNPLKLKKEKIKSWVTQRDFINNYVILDSSTDLGKTLKSHLVSCMNGITNIEVSKCKEILEK